MLSYNHVCLHLKKKYKGLNKKSTSDWLGSNAPYLCVFQWSQDAEPLPRGLRSVLLDLRKRNWVSSMLLNKKIGGRGLMDNNFAEKYYVWEIFGKFIFSSNKIFEGSFFREGSQKIFILRRRQKEYHEKNLKKKHG